MLENFINSQSEPLGFDEISNEFNNIPTSVLINELHELNKTGKMYIKH